MRIFKEAGLRSPRIQLQLHVTKVQIAISVQGRRTEARVATVFRRIIDEIISLTNNILLIYGYMGDSHTVFTVRGITHFSNNIFIT